MNPNYGMGNNSVNHNNENIKKVLIIGSSIIIAVLLSLGSFALLDIISDATAESAELAEAPKKNDYTPPLQEEYAPDVNDTNETDSYGNMDQDFFNVFNINGENYSLPVIVGSLIDNGWRFHNSSEKHIYLSGGKKKDVYLTCPGDSKQRFKICAMNFSEEATIITRCHIISITFITYDLEALNTDVTFYNNKLSVRTLTPTELIAKLGEPQDINETDYTTTYTFLFEDSSDSSIIISFKKGDIHPQWVSITRQSNPA